MSQNGRKDIKLILTDIDGTILPYGETTVSPICLEAFHAAMGAGIHIGPISGRGAARISPVFGGKTSHFNTMLATNGMQIYIDGVAVRELHIDRRPLGKIAELIQDVPKSGLACFDGPDALVIRGSIEDLTASFPVYGPTARYVDEIPHTPIDKANVFTPYDLKITNTIADMLRSAVPELDYAVPHPGFITMTPKGWNKGAAVQAACDELDLQLEQVVVFGDGGNDVEMLSHVPNSVAVAGASPEAKAAARWHIGAVEDDAVPAAIMALARGEWPFTE